MYNIDEINEIISYWPEDIGLYVDVDGGTREWIGLDYITCITKPNIQGGSMIEDPDCGDMDWSLHGYFKPKDDLMCVDGIFSFTHSPNHIAHLHQNILLLFHLGHLLPAVHF